MSESKPASTPMDSNVKLMKTSKSDADKELIVSYRELVDPLTHLTETARPDINFAANCLGL